MFKIILLSVFSIIVPVIHSQPIKCNIYNSVDITNGYRIDDNILFNNVLYTPKYYFVSNITHNFSTSKIQSVDDHVRGCLCEIPGMNCKRLCCPKNYVWVYTMGRCTYAANIPLEGYETMVNNPRTIYGRPCEGMVQLTPSDVKMRDDGVLENFDNDTLELTMYKQEKYCITPVQGFYPDEYDSNEETEPDEEIFRYIYNVCYDEEDNYLENENANVTIEQQNIKSKMKYTIYPIVTIVSIVFLFISILIYSCVPELRNLHGKCVLSYICGLFVGYSILVFINLGGSKIMNEYLCISIGFVGVHAFIFSFLCLNVMCLDIYITFKGFGTTKKMSDRRKFLFYSIYTWGITLLMLIFSTTMQFNGNTINYSPRIGELSCWIKKEWHLELTYLFLPIAILLIINITLFSITAYTIRRLQLESEMFHGRGDSRKHSLRNDKDKFGLFIRLFIVMGITWSFEIISWIVTLKYGEQWIAFVPDLCNALQGIFIFVFVLWKPKVKLLIIKRFRHLFGITSQQPASTRNTSIKSTTSHSSTAGMIMAGQEVSLTTETTKGSF